MVNLEHEEKSMKNVIDEEKMQIDKVADVIDIVEKLMDHSHGLSLGQFAQIFRDIQVIHIFSQKHFTLALRL